MNHGANAGRVSRVAAVQPSAALSFTATKHFSQRQVAQLNALYTRGAAIGFRAMGLELQFSFAANLPDFRPAVAIELTVDGAPMSICLEDFFTAKAIEALLPETTVAAPPPSLKAAILEVAMAESLDAFQQATGRKVAVVSVREHPDNPGEGPRLGFVLREARGIDRLRGWIRADPRSLELVDELLRDRRLACRNEFADLPLPVRLQIGATQLTAAEFESLAPQDIVVMEECYIAADDSLIIRVAPRLAYKARMEGSTIVVTQRVNDTMAQDAPEHPRLAADQLSEVEVRLVFELGEKLLTLEELRSIDPGYVFDLGKDFRRAVAIRANGRLVGIGELVEVEDRVGVRVLEFGGPAP